MLPFLMKLRRVGVVPVDECCDFTVVCWGQVARSGQVAKWDQVAKWGQVSVVQ